MKIGIVCPYSFDMNGGVQEHVKDLATELIKRKHNVEVIAPAKKTTDVPDFVVKMGASVPINVNGSVARFKFGPHTNTRIKNWLEFNQFDCIHIHEPIAPSISYLALINASVPIVATFHSSFDTNTVVKKLYSMFEKQIYKIDKAISVSKLAQKTVDENLNIKSIIIPNGINVKNYSNTKPFEKTTKKRVVFLGRVNEKRKGLNNLLKAWKYVIVACPNAKLFIAGGGKLSDTQMNKIVNYQNSIKVLGKISDTKKARLLKSADCYVAPNLFGESFGIILLEAFASKTPIVASNIQAFSDLSCNGKYAKLFSSKQYKEMATKIIETLFADNTLMVNSAFEYVTKFDWANITTEIEKVYKSVI
jgi:phosphatidylinositol alpha-mannosyltransferase